MNIRPTDLSLLVSLDALLELKNVTRAAKRLNISQPALSSQLARLRVLFNDPLLTPSETGRGMVATPKAIELATPLREAIEKLTVIGHRRGAHETFASEVTFKIAGNNEAISALAPRLIRRAQQRERGEAPIKLCFVQTNEQDLLTQIESGEIDLLLGTSMNFPLALRVRRLNDDRYVMVQRHRHPRGTGALTMSDYVDLQHVQINDSGRDGAVIDEYLSRWGCKRQIGIQLPHWSMVRDALLETDMVATVPSSLLVAGIADEGLECFELPFASPAMPLAIAWHRRSDNDAAHRWLRESCLDITPPKPRLPLSSNAVDVHGAAVDRRLRAVAGAAR